MITTKAGDGGYSTVTGKKLRKDDRLFEAIGALDELQSVIDDEDIQKDLYEIMGEISTGKTITNYELKIKNYELEIERLEKELKPLNNFLIFKNEAARRINWVRTIARRAERRTIFLENRNITMYLNRLSDYLFMQARQKEV